MKNLFLILLTLCFIAPMSLYAGENSPEAVEERLVELYPDIDSAALSAISERFGSGPVLRDAELDLIYQSYQRDPGSIENIKIMANEDTIQIPKVHKVITPPSPEVLRIPEAHKVPEIPTPVAQRSTTLKIPKSYKKIETH